MKRVALCLALVVSVVGVRATGAAIIGSEAIPRRSLDIASGQVYIYAGGSFPENAQMGTFTFFGSSQSVGYLTPVVFEESTPGVFVVRGLGASRSVTGSSESQSFDFALRLGTDITANEMFTFGFVNALLNASGDMTETSTGVVDSTLAEPITPGPGLGGPGSTNRWVFTSTLPGLNVHLATTFGFPGTTPDFALNDPAISIYNLDRTYSANMTANALPEPTSLIVWSVGLGAVGLFTGWRRRKQAGSGV